MTISKQLRLLRESKGITQERISEDLSINRATYAHYETGRRQPDLETIKLLAKYHNCSTDFLLGYSDEKTDEQIHTIAAHALEELTEEEQQKVLEYAKFIKSTRKKDEE